MRELTWDFTLPPTVFTSYMYMHLTKWLYFLLGLEQAMGWLPPRFGITKFHALSHCGCWRQISDSPHQVHVVIVKTIIKVVTDFTLN